MKPLPQLKPISEYKFSLFCQRCGEQMTFVMYQHSPQNLMKSKTIYCYSCASIVINCDVVKNHKIIK